MTVNSEKVPTFSLEKHLTILSNREIVQATQRTGMYLEKSCWGIRLYARSIWSDDDDAYEPLEH